MKISKEAFKEKEKILENLGFETSYDNVSKLVIHDEVERIIDDLTVKEYTVEDFLVFVKLLHLCVSNRAVAHRKEKSNG